MIPAPQVVLFDLDGTLVDSAPDLGAAANALRADQGLEPLPLERYRMMASTGARGMIGVAFGVAPPDAAYEPLRQAFLVHYERLMLDQTCVFEEVSSLLDALDRASRPWGIVTNKAMRLAEPLVRALGLWSRAGVVIGGDTTPHAKPHPEPLLEAARRLQVAPGHCVYVGDDLRDIQAGQRAGMSTMVAEWGYLGQDADIQAWGASIVLRRPGDPLQCLALA